MGVNMHLSLDKITIDAGTQARAALKKETIADYAEAMREGAEFPPCLLYHDGEKYYLVDGFHRYFAAKKIKAPSILVTTVSGTLQEAIERSWSVNDKHGLPRTREDKRKAVVSALATDVHRGKSDRELAKLCGVTHPFVASIKKELEEGKPKVETLPPAAPAPKQEEQEPDENAVFNEEMEATIQLLKAENEALSDKLAIAGMDADELDKAMAESVIKDLRAQIRVLEIELKGVTDSRDSLLRENNQLMKQVASLTKKLKKLEG
jgi:ParB-like chromosome segregation protein Spo0J